MRVGGCPRAPRPGGSGAGGSRRASPGRKVPGECSASRVESAGRRRRCRRSCPRRARRRTGGGQRRSRSRRLTGGAAAGRLWRRGGGGRGRGARERPGRGLPAARPPAPGPPPAAARSPPAPDRAGRRGGLGRSPLLPAGVPQKRGKGDRSPVGQRATEVALLVQDHFYLKPAFPLTYFHCFCAC